MSFPLLIFSNSIRFTVSGYQVAQFIRPFRISRRRSFVRSATNPNKYLRGPVGGAVVNNLPAKQVMQERQLDSWVGKIPRSRRWQPTPVFLPGKLHGQWSLGV